MKKVKISFLTFFCVLLLLTGCSKSSTEVENDYTSYYIIIANYSSYDVTELVISMVGIEDIQQISILAEGEISQRFEFQLPDHPSGCIPINYGDYHGNYLQITEEIYIDIIQPDINILVHINDDGYTIEDVGN